MLNLYHTESFLMYDTQIFANELVCVNHCESIGQRSKCGKRDTGYGGRDVKRSNKSSASFLLSLQLPCSMFIPRRQWLSPHLSSATALWNSLIPPLKSLFSQIWAGTSSLRCSLTSRYGRPTPPKERAPWTIHGWRHSGIEF